MCTDSLKTSPEARLGRLVPPYDTGKVRIGYAYVQYQSWVPGRDMYRLQSALLGPRSSIRVTWLDRLVGCLTSLSPWRHS